MNKLSKISGLLGLGAFMIALNLGSFAGCDSGSSGGGGTGGADDNSVIATSSDALDTSDAAVNLALSAFSAAFGSSGAALTLETVQSFKSAIAATSSAECNEVGLPSVSGDSITLTGDVSGSCAVTSDGTSDSGELVANCNNYNAGSEAADAAIDGELGVEGSQTATAVQSTFDMNQISSNNLIVTLSDGSECSAVIDLAASETIVIATGEFTQSMSGCVRICGEAFTINGSETF
ncbi:MAG TPA: hypothetical protein VLJ37_03485 [bacterium]|nr:hypothetical protein [bacterium]